MSLVNNFTIDVDYAPNGNVTVGCKVCGEKIGYPLSMTQNMRDKQIKKFRKWHEENCHKKETEE